MRIPDLTRRPTQSTRNPIVRATRGSWFENQVYDFCPLPGAPWASSRIVVFCSGMSGPLAVGEQVIGFMEASLSNDLDSPASWQISREPVLVARGWETNPGGIRAGSVERVGGTAWLYYNSDGPGGAIGRASTTDGKRFSRDANNPIVRPSGDEERVSQPAVYRTSATDLVMLYSYRTAQATLPGLRLAMSRDNGATWTKPGGPDVYSNRGLYCEFHQIVRVSTGQYALLCESGNEGTPFRIFVAFASRPEGLYGGSQVHLQESGDAERWDRNHVATAAAFQLPDERWKLLFSATSSNASPYYNSVWSAGIADIASSQAQRLVCDGNSLTRGDGASPGRDYPTQLGERWIGSEVINVAVTAQTTATMLEDARREVDALSTEGAWALCWEGMNDLYFNASESQAYDRLVRYCRERRAAGFRVAIFTLPVRGDFPGTSTLPPVQEASYLARRDAVNARLRDRWSEFADALVDVAADPRLSDYSNPTYFSSADRVHLTDAGYGVVAHLAWSALTSLR